MLQDWVLNEILIIRFSNKIYSLKFMYPIVINNVYWINTFTPVEFVLRIRTEIHAWINLIFIPCLKNMDLKWL